MKAAARLVTSERPWFLMKWRIFMQIWDTRQFKPLSGGFLVKENMQTGGDVVTWYLLNILLFGLLKSHRFCIN